jgi:hypothetical protein
MSTELKNTELEGEDELSCISADMVSFRKYSTYMDRLFALPSGQWVELTHLFFGIGEIEQRLQGLAARISGGPRTSWSDYPDSVYGPGYRVVVFFCDGPLWSNVALYNTVVSGGRFGSTTKN